MARRAGDDADIIVAGAGPAGAAFATRVASAGYDVLLVDRARFPRDKVCGDFVGPFALLELEALGVAGTYGFARTNVVHEAGLHVDGHHLMTAALPQVAHAPADGRVVPRALLDDWIVDAAKRAGARLIEDHTVSTYEITRDGVIVVVRRNGEERRLRARLVVGADGSASAIARTLRGASHPKGDTIIAVRGYYDGVRGPASRCDLYFSRDSFPGYYWLFPTGNAAANVGVGMVLDTIPPTSEHLRDLLLELIRRDPAIGARLAGARLRGKVVGWPLATYSPRLQVSSERVLLLGDAAGLVNPINGEGIQYALLSARWAAETALSALGDDNLSAARLHAYARRVGAEVGLDMALARLVVRMIANRRLNDAWLAMLNGIASRAQCDPSYAFVAMGVMAGVVSAREAFAPKILTGSLKAIAHRTTFLAALRATPMLLRDARATLRWTAACAANGVDLVAHSIPRRPEPRRR